jgi:hypothetical protein
VKSERLLEAGHMVALGNRGKHTQLLLGNLLKDSHLETEEYGRYMTAFRYSNEGRDCENVRWVELVQIRGHCPSLILTVLNLLVLLSERLPVTAITILCIIYQQFTEEHNKTTFKWRPFAQQI